MYARVVANKRDVIDLLNELLDEKDEYEEQNEDYEKEIEEYEEKYQSQNNRTFSNYELAEMVSVIKCAVSTMSYNDKCTKDLIKVKYRLNEAIDSDYDNEDDRGV